MGPIEATLRDGVRDMRHKDIEKPSFAAVDLSFTLAGVGSGDGRCMHHIKRKSTWLLGVRIS